MTSPSDTNLPNRLAGRKDVWTWEKHFQSRNLFQRNMHAWNEVLPYNAVHSIRVEAHLDGDTLPGAIEEALGRCGFNCDSEAIHLADHPITNSPDDTLREVFETELNYRFDPSRDELPFRFFVIRIDSDQFILGVNYFHPVAGADCICWFLEDVVASITGKAGGGNFCWSKKRPPKYSRLILRHYRYLLRGIVSMPKYIRKTRCFTRMARLHSDEAKIRVHSLTLSSSQQEWIYRLMKKSGATFHDVVLSLVIFAMAELLPDRFAHNRRREIALGSVVNIRRHFGPGCEKMFGLFLATFSVSHAVPEGTTLESLLEEIHEVTQRIKRDRLYLRNLLILRADLLWRKFLSPDRKAIMYLKNFPLAASVTNFFVDSFQNRMKELPVRDYWRAVSASPATPLVISITTYQGNTNLTFNFNDSIYRQNEIDTLVENIEGILKSEST